VSKRPVGCLFEVLETLVLTLVIFLIIQNFVAQPYRVQQQSMEHTLEPDQYVLVDKLTPHLEPYRRGDIVVFTPPSDWAREDGTPYIKRVIGVPGDRIRIENKQVFRNGKPINEPYKYHKSDFFDSYRDTFPPEPNTTIDEGARTMLQKHVVNGEIVVPENAYFALGDNRHNSLDSRYWGFVPADHVVGKAWFVWLSYGQEGMMKDMRWKRLFRGIHSLEK